MKVRFFYQMRILVATKIKAETSNPVKSAHLYTTPLHVRHAIAHLRQGLTYTRNIGNLIHFQAPAGLFKSEYTVAGNLNDIYTSCGSDDEYTKFISDNFDAIIFSFANGLRENHVIGKVKLLKLIEPHIKIYGLGLGLQEDVNFDSLLPQTRAFLKEFDKRAVLWGTRGENTTAWLKKQGLKKPQTLGCPSLYLYPQNILNIKELKAKNVANIVTAGHLHKPGFDERQSYRTCKLIDFFQKNKKKYKKLAYIFQDEMFGYKSIDKEAFVYNQATSELDKNKIEKHLKTLYDTHFPFDKYYYFTSVPAWRQCYHHYDCYIGDRFHGGVVGLQASIPSLMICKDLRVKELSEYFGIPHLSINDLENIALKDIVHSKFNAKEVQSFHEKYKVRLKNFQKVCQNHGLNMHLSDYIKNRI